MSAFLPPASPAISAFSSSLAFAHLACRISLNVLKNLPSCGVRGSPASFALAASVISSLYRWRNSSRAEVAVGGFALAVAVALGWGPGTGVVAFCPWPLPADLAFLSVVYSVWQEGFSHQVDATKL